MSSLHCKYFKVKGSTLTYKMLYASIWALAFIASYPNAVHAIVNEGSSSHDTKTVGSTQYDGTFAQRSLLSSTDTFVIRMELWNGNKKTKIMNLQANSNMISLTTSQLSSLNVRSFTRADASNSTFEGSVQYLLRRYNDDDTKDVIFKSVSNTSPYSLCESVTCGSTFIDTRKTSNTSTYVLTAIPYSGLSGTGTKWKSTTTLFTLVRRSDSNTPATSPIKRVPVTVPTPIKVPASVPLSIPTIKINTPLSTSGKWSIVQDTAPITARHESCTAMVNNKMYVIGGRNRAPIDIYDIISNTWTTGPMPPIQLHHMQCVVADSKIWIVSAWTKSYPNEENVDKIYVFDTNDLQWSTRTALPTNRRRGSAASVLVGRRIYVSHGSRGGHATSTNSSVVTLGWLDYYDIDSDTWTTNLPNAPNPRDHTGGALVKDGTMICVSGGRNGAIVGWPAVAETDCYDLTKGEWTVVADIPVLRSGSSYGTTCDGQLMIAGGEGPNVVFSDVHVFDGTTWLQMPSLSQARHGSGLAIDCRCTSSTKVFLPSGSGGPKGGPLLYSVEAYIVDQGQQSCYRY